MKFSAQNGLPTHLLEIC